MYALEIQLYTATKNAKKLAHLYNQALQIQSAIPHPRIMGVIRECGGKMHMAQREWEKARTDFFEAFKNYDEAGAQRRIQCLKYLVLANMLMNSDINPFDSQEAKPYKNDPEVVAMTDLVSAYMQCVAFPAPPLAAPRSCSVPPCVRPLPLGRRLERFRCPVRTEGTASPLPRYFPAQPRLRRAQSEGVGLRGAPVFGGHGQGKKKTEWWGLRFGILSVRCGAGEARVPPRDVPKSKNGTDSIDATNTALMVWCFWAAKGWTGRGGTGRGELRGQRGGPRVSFQKRARLSGPGAC